MTIRSMIKRTGATALSITATLAMIAPTAGHTGEARVSAEDSTNTCIQAFIAANLPKEQPVKVRKENLLPGPLDAHKRAYKIVLTATGAESGKRLARGTCTIDRSGAVALNGRPVSQQLAAR